MTNSLENPIPSFKYSVMKSLIFSIVLLITLSTFSQTPGFIFKPAATALGKAVLDPNGDGYTSVSNAGFGTNDYGTASELNMIALPIINPEPLNDPTTGSNGGMTDICTIDGSKYSVMLLKRNIASGTYAGDYFIVRFRVGGTSTSGKGFSLLFDSDGTNFGSQYSSPANPGYEKELVFQTGSNSKVVLYSYAGVGTQTKVVEYAGDNYHQRSYAKSTNGSNPDYFYDFFVPFDMLGLTTQPVRIIAATTNASSSAVTGVKSDFNGIVDSKYGNDPSLIQTALWNAFPATPVNALSEGGSFNQGVTATPTVSMPAVGSTSISGTSTEAAGTLITVYRAGESIGTTTVQADGSWTLSGISGSLLQTNDEITATATAAPDKTVSALSTVVKVNRCYIEPPVISASSNGLNTIISLTWNWPAGVSPASSVAEMKLYSLAKNAEPSTTVALTPAQQYYDVASGTTKDFIPTTALGNNGVYTANITYGGCVSGYSRVILGTGAYASSKTPPPTYSSPTTIIANTAAQNITLANTHSSAATIILYVNGVRQTSGSAAASPGTVTLSLPAVQIGNVVTIRALATSGNYWLSDATATTVVAGSTCATPTITGTYYSTTTVVKGTSTEVAGTTITLYNSANTAIGTTTVNADGTWAVTGLNLSGVTGMYAKASSSTKNTSAASSPNTSVTAVTLTAPVISGSYTNNSTTVSGTYNGTGLTGSVYARLYIDGSPYDAAGNLLEKVVTGGTWSFTSLPAGTLYRGAVVTALLINNGLESPVSTGVTITGVVSFSVSAPASATAGSNFSVAITAKDGASGTGNTVTTYTQVAAISSTNSVQTSGSLTSSFSSGVMSAHAMVLTTAGASRNITVIAQDDPTVIGTTTLTINAAAASKLVLNTPSDFSISTRGAYSLRLTDAYGNDVVAGAGGVTVNLAATGTGGQFWNAVSGGSTITTVTIPQGQSTANYWFTAGAGNYTVTASSGSYTSATDDIMIFGTASKYVVSAPTYARVGSILTITAQLTDASNNPVSAAGYTVNWTSANGGSFSAASSTTDATGKATISFTASSSASITHTITATTTSPALTGTSGNCVTTNAYVWNGGSNTNPGVRANWNKEETPGNGADVIVLSSACYFPALTGDANYGNLELQSGGRLDLNGASLTVNGNITGNGKIKGSAASKLIFNNSANGTIRFDHGNTNDRNSKMIGGITLNTSGNISIGNEVLVKGKVQLTNGRLVTNDSLVIASDEDSTGYLNGDLSLISGTVIAERMITSNKVNNTVQLNRAWRLLAPIVNTTTTIKDNWQEGVNNPNTSTNLNPNPGYGTHITGSTIGANGFDATITGQPSMYTFNQAAQQWVGINNTNTTNLSATTGYLIFIRGDRAMDLNQTALLQGAANTRLRARGTLVTTNQTFNNLASTTGQVSLITNPFAAPINWISLYNDDNNANNFENYFTIWDPNFGTRGAFVTVSPLEKTPGTYATTDIQSGTAFFVKTKAGAIANSITVKTSHISSTNNIDVFRTGTQQELLRTSLYFTHTDNTRRIADGVVEVYNNIYSAGFDGNDAVQMANWDEDIAILRDGQQLSIESRPLADNGDTINFQIARLREINYEWEFKAENFNAPGLTAYLQDAFTGTETAISLAGTTVVPFTVTSNAASKAAGRFRIVYRGTATLPVTLTSVKAYQQNSGINVSWNTQNESGMQQYEVEQSTTGNNFAKVNTTAAKNGTANSYSWFDASPAQGNNYYRIKAVSLNGEVKYSNIVVVKLGGKGNEMSVYPNPVKGNTISLSLNGLSKGNYTMSVFNQLGQQVLNRVINHNGGNATQTVDLSSLATGIYELRLSNGQTVLTERLVKE